MRFSTFWSRCVWLWTGETSGKPNPSFRQLLSPILDLIMHSFLSEMIEKSQTFLKVGWLILQVHFSTDWSSCKGLWVRKTSDRTNSSLLQLLSVILYVIKQSILRVMPWKSKNLMKTRVKMSIGRFSCYSFRCKRFWAVKLSTNLTYRSDKFYGQFMSWFHITFC